MIMKTALLSTLFAAACAKKPTQLPRALSEEGEEGAKLAAENNRRLGVQEAETTSMSMPIVAPIEEPIIAEIVPRDPLKSCPAPVPTPDPPASREDLLYHWPWPMPEDGDDDHPVDLCSIPRGKVCNGYSYYRPVSGEEYDPPLTDLGGGNQSGNAHYRFTDFFLGGPPNGDDDCVMAPITSPKDLEDIKLHLKYWDFNNVNMWLGVVKSLGNVVNDNGGEGSRANWNNFDGTPADAVCPADAWARFPGSNAPNGRSPHLMIFGPKPSRPNSLLLNDLPNDGTQFNTVEYALFKCCKETVVFPSCDAQD